MQNGRVMKNRLPILLVFVAKRVLTAIVQSPRLHNRLMQKWQQALKGADDWLADLNFGTARQRVSKFILKMRHIDLPDQSSMFSREDMGAMMDLKLETVSREVSGLVRDQVIEPLDKAGRLYRILNEQALTSA